MYLGTYPWLCEQIRINLSTAAAPGEVSQLESPDVVLACVFSSVVVPVRKVCHGNFVDLSRCWLEIRPPSGAAQETIGGPNPESVGDADVLPSI